MRFPTKKGGGKLNVVGMENAIFDQILKIPDGYPPKTRPPPYRESRGAGGGGGIGECCMGSFT